MKRTLVFAIAMCVSLGSAAAASSGEAPTARPATQIGDAVAPWSGKEIASGSEISSSSLKGEAYALVFVNAACSACRGELSDLVKMEFKGLRIFVVSVDAKPRRALTVYRDLLKLPYPVIADSSQSISGLFDFYYTPASVIVDGDGRIEFRLGGYSPKLRETLMSALAKYTN